MGVWGFTDGLERAEAAVAAGVGPVEEIAEALAAPEALGVDRLERQIVSQAAHLSAAMCRWLLLVAEYDRREGYGRWECRSTAHWLEWKCGLASATAREHVRVARALVGLPRIREAFSRAEVSYSKVRALTRAATTVTEAIHRRAIAPPTRPATNRAATGWRTTVTVQRGPGTRASRASAVTSGTSRASASAS